ncbi:hypothetical protein NYA30BAC_01288 [Halomonas sp. NYA30]
MASTPGPTVSIDISDTWNANDASVDFIVTFDKDVTGVNTDDFTLTPTGSAAGNVASVSGSGTSYTVTLDSITGDGSLRLDVNGSTDIVDGAGNTLAAFTGGTSHTVDTVPPAAPATPDLDAGSDSGISNSDDTTNDTTPTLSGTAEANAIVTVSSSLDNQLGTVTADGNGDWAFTPSSALSEGTHNITVTATDVAGNVSASSAALAVVVDTTAPAVPNAPTLTTGTDTGTSNSDGISSNTTPILTGSGAVAAGEVEIYRDNALQATVTADGSGDWTWTSGSLTGGTYAFTARTKDDVGNTSGDSTSLSVTIDTTAPTLTGSTPADDANNVNGADNITLTFDEAVAQGTGNITLYNIDDSSAIATIAAGDTQISGWGGTLISISPTADLPGNTNIAMQWDGTVFQDAAGNTVAGVSDTTTFNFQTANSAPVVDLNGAAGANNAAGDDIASQTFSENGSDVAVAPDVTVSDAEGDTLSATVSISNAATGDALTLNGTFGSITDGDITDSGTDTITISGSHTAADMQAALRAITFSNSSDDPGDTSRTVDFTVNDGNSNSVVRTSTITVGAINDAPALTTPGTITLTDTASDDNFSDQAGQLSGSDPDSSDLTYGFNSAGASAALTEGGITYDLSVEGTYGTLYLEQATGEYLFHADAAAVNALNADASEDFTVSVSDGVAPAVTKILTVDLTGANDAPTVDLNGSTGGTSNTATFAGGGDPIEVTTADATLNDIDNGDQIESLTATLTTRPDDDDVECLSLNSTAGTAASDNGLAVNYNAATGVLSVTGAASASTYQTILRGIQYDNTDAAIDITISDRAVDVVVNDGESDSTTATSTLEVVTAPVVDLGGDGGSGNLSGSYTEDDGAILVASSATITEPDGDNLNQLVIQLTNAQDGASESITLSGRSNGDTVGNLTISYDSSMQITLTGSDTAANYQTLLRELQYENTSNSPDTTERSITVQGQDVNGNTGATAILSLPVEPVNDTPTATNLTQTVAYTEDPGSAVSLFDTEVTLEDVDGDTLTATVTLSDSAAGTLASSNGGSFDTATGTWTMSGDAATVQTALNGLQFSPATNLDKVSTASVTVSDGTASAPVGTVTLDVTPVNDAPVIATNSGPSVRTGNTVTLTSSHIDEDDPDDEGAELTYTLDTLPTSGTLQLNGSTLAAGETFTQQDIDDGLVAFTAGGTTGTASFDITLADGGEDGAGTVSGTVSLTVTAPPPTGGSNGGNTNDNTSKVDGATVSKTTTTRNGRTEEVTEIVPTDETREDDPNTENGSLADVPLAQDEGVDTPALKVGLPTGVGMRAEGAPTRLSKQDALNDLITRIQQKTPENSAPQQEMTGIGQSFLNELPEDSQLFVKTVTPTVAEGAQLSSPITITGAGESQTGNQQEALVIDASSLPSGTELQLDDVNFAAIVGEAQVIGGTGRNVVTGDDNAQYIVLGEDDDVLYGGGGGDVVGSKGGDDRLFGGSGNDELFGGAGADLLHGGNDTDKARYDGNRDDYIVTQEHGVITVQAKDDANDIDELVNIEILSFADGEENITYDDDLAWITGLYDQVLGRQGDVEGVQYWAKQHADGMSRADMALLFMSSPEADQDLTIAVDDTGGVLDTLYHALLGREADAPGKAYWTSELENGSSLRDVVGGFMASEEMLTHDLTDTQWDFIA